MESSLIERKLGDRVRLTTGSPRRQRRHLKRKIKFCQLSVIVECTTGLSVEAKYLWWRVKKKPFPACHADSANFKIKGELFFSFKQHFRRVRVKVRKITFLSRVQEVVLLPSKAGRRGIKREIGRHRRLRRRRRRCLDYFHPYVFITITTG